MSDSATLAPRPIAIEGGYLVLPDRIKLPPRCVRTNAAIQESDYRHFDLAVRARHSLLVLFFIGPMFYVLYAFRRRPRCRFKAAVSPAVRRRYALQQSAGGLFVLLATFGVMVLIALGVRSQQAIMLLVLAAPFVMLTGLFLLASAPLQCVRNRGQEFWIAGCGASSSTA